MFQRLFCSVALAAWSTLAWGATIVCQFDVKASPRLIAYRHGLQFVDYTSGAPFALFATRPGQSEDKVLEMLRLDRQVVWAEDNIDVETPEGSGAGKGSTIAAVGDRDALYDLNSGWLQQIGFDRSLAMSPGRGVRVAVLDTGVSPNQPSLLLKTVASINFVELREPAYDLPRQTDSNGNGDRDEMTGHGTMVAGIVDQLAPLTELVVARVADSDGLSTAWRLMKGIAFAVQHHAEVVNISLGSLDEIKGLEEVITWAWGRGVTFVAPIGNNNLETMLSPSSNGEVIGVAGVDEVDHRASFSNWHRDTLQCAPATGIKSFWWDGTLGIWSGTSFASPMVAAGIADSLRRRSPAPPRAIRDAVEQAGTNINALNPAYDRKLGRRLQLISLDNHIRGL